jgi:hypothetical protein
LRNGLADARREVRNLIVMGMKPGLTTAKAELIRKLERSARAEVKLRATHLVWFESQIARRPILENER